jgi:hypothetical protein
MRVISTTKLLKERTRMETSNLVVMRNTMRRMQQILRTLILLIQKSNS